MPGGVAERTSLPGSPSHRPAVEGQLEPPAPAPRQARTREWKGSEVEQWEYEITSGGRVRYLVSPDTSTVILVYASPRHPKDTE